MKLKFKSNQKMRKLFKKEFTLRIISVALGIFLWVFVNDEINPFSSLEVTVPLKIKNENILSDNGLTIVNKNIPKSVSIALKGRKSKMSGVSADSVEAFISMDKIDNAGKGLTLPIEVTLDNNRIDDGISIDNFSPKIVETDIERSGKNIFKVELVTKGEVKSGYKILSASLSPESISLSGGATFFSSVASVKAYADLNGVDHELSITKDCRIFDKNGKEITIPNKTFPVNINIEIGKEVPIVPVISGKPDSGYSEIKRQSNPSKVDIKGSPDILDNIDDIRTETFVIDGIKENVTKRVNLSVPNDVKLWGTSKEVDVSVNVEKNLQIPVSLDNKDIEIINNKPEFTYEFKDTKTDIDIFGTASKIGKFTISALKAKIDVIDCKVGSNDIPLKLILPEGIRIKKDYMITVIVSNTK